MIKARNRQARSYARPSAPVAAFSADAPIGAFPRVVTFTNESTGNPYLLVWDFGNGETATGPGPHAVTYAGPGPYTVTLTVTGGGGSDAEVKTGHVVAVPGFLYAPSVGGSLAAGYLWSDLAKTTLAAADGDRVAVLKDTASGAEFTNAAGAARPTLRISGAKSWLEFDGVANYLRSPAHAAWVALAHAVFNTVRPAAFSDYVPVACASEGGSAWRMCAKTTDPKWGTYDGAAASAGTTLITGTDYVLGMNGGAFRLNAAGDGTYAASLGGAPGSTLDVATDGTRFFSGRWYDGYFGTAALAGADLAAVEAWAASLKP